MTESKAGGEGGEWQQSATHRDLLQHPPPLPPHLWSSQRWSRLGLRLPSRVNTAEREAEHPREPWGEKGCESGCSAEDRAAFGVVTEIDGC